MTQRLCILVVALASLLLGGCSKPLWPYSLETYPLVLTPSSLANIEDGRDRFRQVYCAVPEAEGQQQISERRDRAEGAGK